MMPFLSTLFLGKKFNTWNALRIAVEFESYDSTLPPCFILIYIYYLFNLHDSLLDLNQIITCNPLGYFSVNIFGSCNFEKGENNENLVFNMVKRWSRW